MPGTTCECGRTKAPDKKICFDCLMEALEVCAAQGTIRVTRHPDGTINMVYPGAAQPRSAS